MESKDIKYSSSLDIDDLAVFIGQKLFPSDPKYNHVNLQNIKDVLEHFSVDDEN